MAHVAILLAMNAFSADNNLKTLNFKKMKTLFHFILLLAVLGCGDDNGVKPNPTPSSLSGLVLSKTLSLVPIATFKNEGKVIFVNGAGEEKAFQIDYIEGSEKKYFQSIVYDAEFVSINYNENENGGLFLPSIKLEPSYWTLTESHEFLIASIQYGGNNGFIPSVTLENTSEPVFGKIVDSINIADRLFEHVFTNAFVPDGVNSFS